MRLDDGGPAFPATVSNQSEDGSLQTGETAFEVPGMSLRDYFAAQALTGIMSDDGMRPSTVGEFKHMAERLYQVSDAMLEARKR